MLPLNIQPTFFVPDWQRLEQVTLHRPFSELQYLRKNFILRLTINNFVSVIPKKQRHSLITSDDTDSSRVSSASYLL